jgi:FKBP-type peptidyl-prolyl cis-trans isomerase 2
MMRTTPTKVKEIDGVKCTVDVNSDIANDQVDLSLQIVRKGQAKIINVSISYARTI